MSSTSVSTFSTSSSRVAGQPLLSLEVSDTFRRMPSNSCSPLSLFSSNSWDIQDHENVYDSDEDWESSSSSSSGAETMIWDSPPPSSSGLPEPLFNSVLEDWNDDPIPSPIPTIIIEEEDGAQTVVIDVQSPFFSPPLAPGSRSSGSEGRFPLGLPPNPKRRRDIIPDGIPASAISPYPPCISESHSRFEAEQPELPMKSQMLFVITASLQGGFALSSPLFYSLEPNDEAELWAPKDLMHGPDVPLDYIYPTCDIATMGNWDQTS